MEARGSATSPNLASFAEGPPNGWLAVAFLQQHLCILHSARVRAIALVIILLSNVCTDLQEQHPAEIIEVLSCTDPQESLGSLLTYNIDHEDPFDGFQQLSATNVR